MIIHADVGNNFELLNEHLKKMNRHFIIMIAILFVFACNNEHARSSKKESIIVDKIHIGMTIQEMKALYAEADFIEEPLFNYDIDSEEKGITVRNAGESLFFVWTLQGNDTITGIEIISDRIIIDRDVHVGMTLEDFLKKYPKSKLAVDELTLDYEYIHIPNLDYRVDFLTTDSTRAAEFDYSTPEPTFISIKRPQTLISRISI